MQQKAREGQLEILSPIPNDVFSAKILEVNSPGEIYVADVSINFKKLPVF